MPEIDEQELMQEPDGNTLPPSNQIIIEILPDHSFLIDQEPVPDMKTLVQHLVAIVKESSSNSPHEAFSAGFEAKP